MLKKCFEILKQKHPCNNCLIKAMCTPKSKCDLKVEWEKHFRSYYVPLFIMFAVISIFAIIAYMGISYTLWFFRIIDNGELEKSKIFKELFYDEEYIY